MASAQKNISCHYHFNNNDFPECLLKFKILGLVYETNRVGLRHVYVQQAFQVFQFHTHIGLLLANEKEKKR